ncbi:phage protein [Streptococcus suis]|uniref:Phage protein n=1 Tax=Streptococcus suis TaxID=1307 RepID=A0A0Z8D3M2_STRSU|nr:phage protein [Streptococcus suis]CYV15766.1 phage protein [Streptococcus suis]CYV26284.1 phage protein [Streptococcus suis]CYV42974.1 phage protein [Streptococcus suis]
MKLLSKIKNKIRGGIAMMVNLYFMQVEEGWITLEQVPKKYRERVRKLLELSELKDGK